MSQLRNALVSTVGRVAIAAMLLLGLVTITPMFGGAASAHKAGISAEVSCDGTVSWSAHSWSSDDQGSNPDVRVTEHAGSRDSGSSDVEVGKGSFDHEHGYQFSGHFEWPAGASTVVVSTKPMGEWGSGHETDDSDNVEITKPTDCDHHPEVDKVLECENSAPGHGEGVVDLTLTNPAGPFGHSAEFEISGPDGSEAPATYHVPAGGKEKVSFHHLSDGHHTVHMKVDGEDMSQDVEVHCDQAVPSVTKSAACVAGNGSITVNLANTGGETAEFDVTDPITHQLETISLEPNQSASRTFSGLADGTYVVKVMVGQMDLSQHFEVKCDHVDVHPPDECPTVDQHHDTHSASSVDDHHCTPPPADGSIEVAKACVDQDGQVTITLIATGTYGADAVKFTVEGVPYTVEPGSTKQVVLGGLLDGTRTIHVWAGKHDLSFQVAINCDPSPRVTVTQSCIAFDGSVSLLLENLGDDVSATFTINGVDHVVAAGASDTVVINGLPDGHTSIMLAINGVAMPDVGVNFSCDPVVQAKAACNAVSNTGVVDVYWYTITNTESSDLQFSWDAGTATVPAGESRTIGSHSATLSLKYQGVEVASAAASDVTCSRTVTFQKQLIGAPTTPETYSIRVSRLVGDTFVPEVTFELVAGTPTTITLPSTLDPAGIQYKVVEIGKGTANTSVITPDMLTLSGHLGQTVSVTVTNGYASVTIDKQVSATQIGLGGQLTYTLQAKNTGGLTLDPVVVYDRLPSSATFVSGAVAGDAGTCALTQSAHPQLVTCTLNAAIAAGGSSPVVTIKVTVDSTATVGASLLNTAKVVGSFGPAPTLTEPVGAALSCLPAVDGTVCALSAAVSTSIVESSPPVPSTSTPGPTTTVDQGGPLPSTGGSPFQMLLAGFVLAASGAAMVLSRRRRPQTGT